VAAAAPVQAPFRVATLDVATMERNRVLLEC
jgi:hypothetical protein